MKCKCDKIIPIQRVNLGFRVCVDCSTTEQYGCAPVINHKTGNSIQIMSASDAERIAKLTRRKGYGTMLGAIALLITLSSCSDKVLSAHGQESDYYYEQMIDMASCENCDEVD